MWYDCQWDNYPQKTKMTQTLTTIGHRTAFNNVSIRSGIWKLFTTTSFEVGSKVFFLLYCHVLFCLKFCISTRHSLASLSISSTTLEHSGCSCRDNIFWIPSFIRGVIRSILKIHHFSGQQPYNLKSTHKNIPFCQRFYFTYHCTIFCVFVSEVLLHVKKNNS